MRPIRVLLADDHPTIRKGLGALIASISTAELVGEASSGREAVEMAALTTPDVVVMDLNMPDIGGVEATKMLSEQVPNAAVLVLTMLDDDESVFAAMRAGAKGYIVKGADTEDVVRAIESVARGDAVFGPAVASRILGFLTRPLSAHDGTMFPQLTDREREVLELIARGRSNSKIASDLVLSPKTIRNHVSNIFSKLAVADRAEAIVRARRAGMGTDG